MSGPVEIAHEGRVLRMALNRPEHRNVLTQQMVSEMFLALDTVDEGTGAILIQGRGDFFCYGGGEDLPEELWRLRERLTIPLVAAVHGAALGAGMALAACAHVVVAAQGTSFGLLEIRNKIYPRGIHAVANAIGWRRATELALTGRVCSTPEALQMGLVHEVAPAFEFESRAESTARLLSEADAGTVRRILKQQQQHP
jgi:enoyl-CoA hydratase/carnithine racemase